MHITALWMDKISFTMILRLHTSKQAQKESHQRFQFAHCPPQHKPSLLLDQACNELHNTLPFYSNLLQPFVILSKVSSLGTSNPIPQQRIHSTISQAIITSSHVHPHSTLVALRLRVSMAA
jgi:hypothetical protein